MLHYGVVRLLRSVEALVSGRLVLALVKMTYHHFLLVLPIHQVKDAERSSYEIEYALFRSIVIAYQLVVRLMVSTRSGVW